MTTGVEKRGLERTSLKVVSPIAACRIIQVQFWRTQAWKSSKRVAAIHSRTWAFLKKHFVVLSSSVAKIFNAAGSSSVRSKNNNRRDPLRKRAGVEKLGGPAHFIKQNPFSSKKRPDLRQNSSRQVVSSKTHNASWFAAVKPRLPRGDT